MVYYEGNNMLLLILLVIVALVPFLSLLNKLQPIYPLIIFSISLSLLYHIVLSSLSFGGDAYIEYGFSNMVLKEGIWNPSSIVNSSNAVASINILVPIICQLCAVDIMQAFKIIYPILLSLVPVGLYSILKRQINLEYAFLSVYFLLSVRFFYTWVSEFVKQGFAMFFLIVVMLIFTSKIKRSVAESLMLVFFSFLLVTSHYGVSYLFLIYVPVAMICQILIKDREINPLFSYFSFYIALTISWYMYVSAGYAFESIVCLGERIVSNIHELFNPETSDTLALLVKETPYFSKLTLKGLYLLVNTFIALGLLRVIHDELKGLRSRNWSLSSEYVSFAIPSFCFLVASLFPYVTRYGMDISRAYCVLLLFLAPFCIIGFLSLIDIVKNSLKPINAGKALTVLFAIFLLFNSGFVTEILGEKDVGSVAISQARINSSGTPYEKASLYTNYFAEEDIFSAKWLSEHRENQLVSSDFYAIRVLSSYGMYVGKGDPMGKELLTPTTVKNLDEGTYVYLRRLNWKYGIMTKFIWEEDWIWNISDIMPDLNNFNMIYSNGGSVIFLKSE
ncbi:MAG: DUF2206 domain-containing protein [Candidatus Bathyarchaeia archaeon]